MKNTLNNKNNVVRLFHSRYAFKKQNTEGLEILYTGLSIAAPKVLLKSKTGGYIPILTFKYVTIFKQK